MASHAIVNLDKIQASKVGNIESLQHAADTDNGLVAHVGALVAGENELKQVVVPTTASIQTDEVVLLATPEVNYLPGTSLEDFFVPSGGAIRAFHLTEGDVFTVSDDGIDGATALNQYVVPQNNSLKLAAAADLTGGTRFAAKVIQKGTIGFNQQKPSTTVQVVKV